MPATTRICTRAFRSWCPARGRVSPTRSRGFQAGAGDRIRARRGLGLASRPAAIRRDRRRVAAVRLPLQIAPPRSAYIMAGAARTDWEHGLPPARARRYSLTFRTLADGFVAP